MVRFKKNIISFTYDKNNNHRKNLNMKKKTEYIVFDYLLLS